MSLQSAVGALLNLLFPPRCPFCQQLSPGDEPALCPKCARSLPRAEGAFSAEGFDSGVFLLYYEGTVRESLLRFKFGGCAAYSRVYGEMLAQYIAEALSGAFDLVSYVPVSRRRRLLRGYDQAKLLAQQVSAAYGVRPVTTLEKIRHNPAQSSMADSRARRRNVRGVYRAVHPEAFAGRRVLLLDDIATTGATLSEAARTLRAAGAASVVCAVLAKPR